MSHLRCLFLLTLLAVGGVSAQTTDPAKVAALQQRFQQGLDLEEQGKLQDARAVYDGILADEPKARASLLHAGMISQHLKELDKANDYLGRLHELEPKYPAAIEALIQINQSLGHAPRVVSLIQEFKNLHESGEVPAFSSSLYFVRERVDLPDGGQAVFCEFFDYTKDPNTAWMMQKFNAQGTLVNWILLNYDAADTANIRQKDPAKLANVEVFLLQEDVIKDNRIKSIDVYQQILSLPSYEKVRTAMLGILNTPPTPLHSEPTDLAVPDFDKDASAELSTTPSPSATPPASAPAPIPTQATVPGQ